MTDKTVSAQLPLVGLVLTYNGERLLEKCLQSMQFCQRIIIVDSFSTDATLDIAKKCGAEVWQNPWQGGGSQFAYAFKKLDNCWVFSLDQDEICSKELRQSIMQLFENGKIPQEYSGFYMPRRSWYVNHFMKHSGWYPDYLLRVFQIKQMDVRMSGAHYSFHPQGKTKKITGDIIHYTYSSYFEQLAKINSYAEQGAADLRAKGRKGGIARGLSRGFARMIKEYFFKLGFLDGKAGFINALHSGFYTFSKYVRIEEKKPWGSPYDHE